MSSAQDVIDRILAKIKTEEEIVTKAVAMRDLTSNAAVQQSVDAQLREGRRNLDYLYSSLEAAKHKLAEQSGARYSSGPQNSQQGRPVSYNRQSYGQESARPDAGGYGAPARGGYMDQLGAGTGSMPASGPFAPQAPGAPIPKPKPNYSRLDLIKDDSTYLTPRYQLMLSQLTFKLSVEKQYKDGIDKLVKLYSDDGDRKSKEDAELRRIESIQKTQLLTKALKRYEDLNFQFEIEGPNDDDSINMPQLRKPLSGSLMIQVIEMQNVDHSRTGNWTVKKMESYVSIKIEDAFVGKTKNTKNDTWADEPMHFEVDKGNEIEFTVMDKGKYPVPVAMLWIRISDIVEEMRRKKIETELSGSQWVTADQMSKRPGGGPQGSVSSYQSDNRTSLPASGKEARSPVSNDPNTVSAWFSLEPAGRLHLALSFSKHNRGKATFDAGLNRKGAVRQRKDEVQEQYGHKFVTQQFYSIMRCALCGDFLKYGTGMQCTDCNYTCHEKCFQKVVTKCISKSNAETDPDEEKLNHRIPHRFEAYTNLSANWCCHCGYMLPFGKRNSRKCTECALTVHANCAHLVPDFCGMPMQRANEILQQLKGIQRRPQPALDHRRGALGDKTLRQPSSGRPIPQSQLSYLPSPADSDASSERLPTQQRNLPYRPGTYDQPPPPIPPTIPEYPQTTSPRQDRPGGPARTQSEMALAAAKAAGAAMGGAAAKPAQQRTGPYPGQYGRSDSEYGRQADQQQQQQQSSYNPGAYAQYDRPQPHAPQIPVMQPSYGAQPPQQMTSLPTQKSPVKTEPGYSQQQDLQQQQQLTKQKRVGLEHFNFLAVLGKGNFGKVMLAETKATKKLYAIKVLKKEFIIEHDEVESTKSEKRVFLIANKERHPFLLNLHACFQTETRVYFVMEYISGGDLMLHIQRGSFGAQRAQFYAAEVCLALKYFHENGVIYRDLKLDNILLTLDGHIKIADYGLCKENMFYGDTTGTFCGTPEFMAPEILLDKKYSRAVDWWAFGVLIYQMLLQQSPFRGDDEDEIYEAILSDEPLYPIHMPRDSVSILQKLLTREPELRLGSGVTDAQEIMSHAFFKNINWQDIRDKKVEPPFKPSIKHAADTSNFDNEFTSVTPVLTPVNSVLTSAMQEEFMGFSYSAEFV